MPDEQYRSKFNLSKDFGNNFISREKSLVTDYFYSQFINPLASPSAGAPALRYGDISTVTPSPGEVKGLIVHSISFIILIMQKKISIKLKNHIP